MQRLTGGMVSAPHRPALHAESAGVAVTVLPASPYQVSYVPVHHVIGFTFERQQGVDAFGGTRRRPFDAKPWKLAFTPVGCDVFSVSDRGGEYLVLSVAPDTFSRLAPRVATGGLRHLTNVAAPSFTPLAIALRRIAMRGAAAPLLAIEALVAEAVEQVSVLISADARCAPSDHRLPAWRLKRILDHFEARLAEDIRLVDVARDCGVSECYLARAFRTATGMTLHAALVERRIARARSLIENTAVRRAGLAGLAHVAAATGFSSHAHMTTAFRRVLGVTPSEWARMSAR